MKLNRDRAEAASGQHPVSQAVVEIEKVVTTPATPASRYGGQAYSWLDGRAEVAHHVLRVRHGSHEFERKYSVPPRAQAAGNCVAVWTPPSFVRGSTLNVYNLQGRELRRLSNSFWQDLMGVAGEVTAFALSKDGSKVAFTKRTYDQRDEGLPYVHRLYVYDTNSDCVSEIGRDDPLRTRRGDLWPELVWSRNNRYVGFPSITRNYFFVYDVNAQSHARTYQVRADTSTQGAGATQANDIGNDGVPEWKRSTQTPPFEPLALSIQYPREY